MLSLFMREPQFQGQTKEKLTSPEAARLVETALRDHFDHCLAGDPATADNLLAFVIERAEERLRRARGRTRRARSATRKLRLPGKLTDCTARGRRAAPRSSWSRATAPAARPSRRATARPRRCCRCAARSSTSPAPRADKLRQNQELKDLIEALGCGVGERFDADAPALRPRHHHDRRRRGRRAYRLAADDVLLSRAAGADPPRATSISRSRRCTG